MDANHINTFLSVAGGLVAALGGWEFIKYMLNRRNNERINAAKAFQTEYETLMSDYKRMQQKVDDLNKKVDELYEKLRTYESKLLEATREKYELELALKEAEKHVCLQPDDKCLQRLTPNVKCRLVTLLRGGYTEDHPDAIITEEDMLKPLKTDEDNGVPENADKG